MERGAKFMVPCPQKHTNLCVRSTCQRFFVRKIKSGIKDRVFRRRVHLSHFSPLPVALVVLAALSSSMASSDISLNFFNK